MDRILNWAPQFDEKSREFPIRAAIGESVVRRNKLWRVGPVLDQGREGACVGFGWSAEAFATPTAVDLSRVKADVPREPNKFAANLYHLAKTLDNWPGEDYDGTSVLAGAKAMRQFGLIKEFRWAFSINDVIDSVIQKGPVVLGIQWHSSMYKAPNGVLDVKGEVVGGHCITAVGYCLPNASKSGEEAIILQNSWGEDWGNKGLAEIKVTDLAILLKESGEACVPSRRSYGR